MNYADSLRKAQTNYDAMEPPSDPPWLEDAAAEAFDDSEIGVSRLREAIQESAVARALELAPARTRNSA